MKSVPESVDVAQDCAGNLIPVGLGICKARHSQVLGGTTDRPSCLGDPDRLAASNRSRVVVGLEESLLGILDGVVHGILEIWVCIRANEVDGRNNSIVGTVDPGGPGINMANGNSTQRCAGKSRPDLTDEARDDIWTGSDAVVSCNASRRNAVQILATHGKTNHVAGEIGILGDGRMQRRQFVVEAGLAARGPHSEQKRCLGRNSSRNSLSGTVGSARLHHGIEPGTCETRGAHEILGGGEIGLEVSLSSGRAIGERGAIVEALESRRRGRSERGGDGPNSCCKHCKK